MQTTKVWPAGISVRTFRPGDERTFYEVHQESFEDHWEHDAPDPYDEWARAKWRAMWAVAEGRFEIIPEWRHNYAQMTQEQMV